MEKGGWILEQASQGSDKDTNHARFQELFRQHSYNMLWFLGGPLWSLDSDSVILVCPFQLRILYDWKIFTQPQLKADCQFQCLITFTIKKKKKKKKISYLSLFLFFVIVLDEISYISEYTHRLLSFHCDPLTYTVFFISSRCVFIHLGVDPLECSVF